MALQRPSEWHSTRTYAVLGSTVAIETARRSDWCSDLASHKRRDVRNRRAITGAEGRLGGASLSGALLQARRWRRESNALLKALKNPRGPNALMRLHSLSHNAVRRWEPIRTGLGSRVKRRRGRGGGGAEWIFWNASCSLAGALLRCAPPALRVRACAFVRVRSQRSGGRELVETLTQRAHSQSGETVVKG